MPSAAEVGRLAARKVAQAITRAPAAVIGLATGSSPLAIYAELASQVRAGNLDPSQLRGFALDEYVGIPEEHPQSYASVLRRVVVEPLGLDPSQVALPDGRAADLAAACQAYELEIREAGGVDLQILGLGAMRGRAGRGGARRAARPALHERARARPAALQARRRRRGARRVPSPGLAVGLRDPRRAGRARRRPRRRAHADAAGRAARVRGRALRRAARPGRLHRPDAGRRPRRAARALPGARLADRAGGRRARLPGRARRPLPGAHRAAATRRGVRRVGPRRAAQAAAAGPRRRPLSRPRTHRGSSASRPTSRTGCGCWRSTPSAISRRRTRPRPGTATTRSRSRCASWASS